MVNVNKKGPPFVYDDVFEEENVNINQFPKTMPGTFFPEKPTATRVDKASYLLPFLQDSSDPKHYSPKFTDEEINALYAPTDFSSQKKLALAQFGFGLMRPTEGGRIGAPLAASGAQLASDLSQIKTAQQLDAKKNAQGRISAKMEREAQNMLERKAIDDMNRDLLLNISTSNYEQDLAMNQNEWNIYKDAMKSAQSKFMDYQLEGVTPKQVQVAYKDEDGIGIPFDAFVVQSILDNGELSSPQYYKPTNEIGNDGLPIMELIENPANLVTVPLSMTGKADDFQVPAGATTFLDILTGLQTTDRALLTLDELEESFRARPGRAGFIAGIKGRFQTYAQIFSDLYGEQFNQFFSEDDLVQFNEENGISKNYTTGEFAGQRMDKFQNMASTISLYLSDANIQEDIANGTIGQEEVDALNAANNAFSQLAAAGYGQMKADSIGGVNYFLESRFEGTDGRSAEEEKQVIFNKLRFFDVDLPANQVRANSIIYAIARARKSSGRLNLDDIERAAKDLNIYGDSSVDVIAKIDVLRTQLVRSRTDALANIQIMYGQGKDNYYDRLVEMGYLSYNRDRTNEYVTDPKKQGYISPTSRTAVENSLWDYEIGGE